MQCGAISIAAGCAQSRWYTSLSTFSNMVMGSHAGAVEMPTHATSAYSPLEYSATMPGTYMPPTVRDDANTRGLSLWGIESRENELTLHLQNLAAVLKDVTQARVHAVGVAGQRLHSQYGSSQSALEHRCDGEVAPG